MHLLLLSYDKKTKIPAYFGKKFVFFNIFIYNDSRKEHKNEWNCWI